MGDSTGQQGIIRDLEISGQSGEGEEEVFEYAISLMLSNSNRTTF